MPNPTLHLRQQRFDHRPQLVIDIPRLRPSHPTPPDHLSQSDPTTSKIILLGVLTPAVREGLRFGLRHQMLTIEQGSLRGSIPSKARTEGELADLIKAASLIGRWTAKSDNPSTVFALLGVRP
ncbi:three component ABC system middle component [Streptomyces sp. NPDC000877]|uniref:three component ABC system middle component n=1 Tax=unclassified Streptomyces TaxID=2593676 RepID=UPI003333E2F7